MNAKDTDLEKVFTQACKDMPMRNPRHAWPAISDKMDAKRARFLRPVPALCTVAVLLLILAAFPQVRAGAQEMIRKLFSVKYSLTVGRYKTEGVLVSPDGKENIINTPDGKVAMRIETAGENEIKVSAKVYTAQGEKIANPKMITRKDKGGYMGISRAGGGNIFTLTITPTEGGVYKAGIKK
jgi:hypothetical protein